MGFNTSGFNTTKFNIDNTPQSFDYANEIWKIADYMRDTIKRAEYNRIILPFTLLRRLECALVPTREAVIKAVEEHEADWGRFNDNYCQFSGKAFYKKYEEAQAAEVKRIAMEEEAKGIEAIGIAEARALELKAEAMAKLNEAGKLEMLLSALPEIVKAASDPLNKVGSITMYGDGNNTRLVKDVMTTVNQISEGVGLDIAGLVNRAMPKEAKDNGQ